MDDIVYYNELYDIYGKLLTDKQRSYFEDYYFNNLSFAEIAENNGVSRNAAFRQLHMVIDKLEDFENKLEFRKKKMNLINVLKLRNIDDEIIEKLRDIL